MRSMRQATAYPFWPSLRDARGRLLGLPFVLIGCAPGAVFGWKASLAALMIASLASFLVYVPLTVLALNRGAPLGDNAPVPALTARAYVTLLTLWTLTTWAAATVAPHL